MDTQELDVVITSPSFISSPGAVRQSSLYKLHCELQGVLFDLHRLKMGLLLSLMRDDIPEGEIMLTPLKEHKQNGPAGPCGLVPALPSSRHLRRPHLSPEHALGAVPPLKAVTENSCFGDVHLTR